MKRYLILFMATGLPMTLLGIPFTQEHGFPLGPVLGLCAGVFVGGTVTIVFGIPHHRALKRRAAERSEEAIGVHQVDNAQLPLSYDRAFDLSMEAVSLMDCTVQKEDRFRGTIIAKTGMSSKSFGEIVSIEITQAATNSVQIQISSRPKQRTALFDFGKNLDNVDKIIRFLNVHSAR